MNKSINLIKTIEHDQRFAFWVFTILILFITSPSFSILKGLGATFYFPNEKIAVAITGLFLLTSKETILEALGWVKKVYYTPLLVLGFILVRDLDREVFLRADYNTAITMISILLYALLFRKNLTSFIRAFKVVTWIHLVVAVYQLIFVFLDKRDLAMIFHNHPWQEEVKYYFFYRVSGLFMESGQFAPFLALGLIIQRLHLKSCFSWLGLCSLLMLVVNKSLTAYLVLLIFMLMDQKIGQKVLAAGLTLLAIDLLTLKKTLPHFKELWMKLYFVYFQFVDWSTVHSERVELARQKFTDSIKSPLNFLTAHENVINKASGDFITYYLYAFGLIGTLLISIFLFKVIRFRPKFLLPYLILFVTCAPITHPVQIMYILTGLLLFSKQIIESSKSQLSLNEKKTIDPSYSY